MARRLAAILAADVVGYSSLMNDDETGTLAALKAHRAEVFDPVIAERGGRLVKLMGDGALVEFPSVVERSRWRSPSSSGSRRGTAASGCASASTWATSSSTATTSMATASTWRQGRDAGLRRTFCNERDSCSLNHKSPPNRFLL